MAHAVAGHAGRRLTGAEELYSSGKASGEARPHPHSTSPRGLGLRVPERGGPALGVVRV